MTSGGASKGKQGTASDFPNSVDGRFNGTRFVKIREKSLRKQFPSFLEDKEISKRGAMLCVVLQKGEGGIKMGRSG